MKKIVMMAAGASLALVFASCGGRGNGSVSLKSDVDSASYATGLSMGERLAEGIEQSKSSGDSIDVEAFLKGFKDGANDSTKFSYYAGAITGSNMSKSIVRAQNLDLNIFIKAFEAAVKKDSTSRLLSDSVAKVVAEDYAQKMQEKEMEKQFGKNKEAGKAFVDKFKNEHKDAKTTPSGLVYIVEKEGSGITPTAVDTVDVVYKGTLVDGKQFDATPEGTTTTFPVNQVIKGWTEILQQMKEGGKVKVVIPYDLAYGSRGSYSIEPFSTLIFEIELRKVKKDTIVKK